MSTSRGNTNFGAEQLVNARRTESFDAAKIVKHINSATEQLFGRVNILNLIERSNLAVTLVNQDDELLGQGCFLDYPNIASVDPAKWESWLPSCYQNAASSNSMNTLFLHFFVARNEYSHGAAKEIVMTAFNAVPELHYVYLLVPKNTFPEPALSQIFSQVDVEGSSGIDDFALFSCMRDKFAPTLHVRQARVQDHDDLTPIFSRQSDMLTNTYGSFFLAELIEAQNESMHCLVAEVDGTAVGFMSLCSEVNHNLLNKCFDLGPLHGLRKPHPNDVGSLPMEPHAEDPLISKDSTQKEKENVTISSVIPMQKRLSEEILDYMSDVSGSLSTSSASTEMDKSEYLDDAIDIPRPPLEKTEPILPKPQQKSIPQYFGESNAFSIQLFCIDEQYDMRSSDLLRAAFARMPEKDFAIITIPHLVPEFPLLQKFLRVSPRITSTLSQELYVMHRMGLTEEIRVRDAVKADSAQIEALVSTLTLKENLITDFRQYLAARRDPDGTELRAFVAEVDQQVVGISIIRREEDIEYLRSHYNIEDFIYYNHHGRTEHGHLHHFALNPIFSHYAKFFLKEIMRKSHKTCLYYPVFPATASKTARSQHSLITCLSELVPVRPRRQIKYPLDILEDRAPSVRVLQKKEPFALCHFNRKLTLEPKVVINARIVVVGASNTGLAYLETLAFCPHLKFNNLYLVSPHGMPGELPPDAICDELLGTDLCYTSDDHSNISLRSWVNVVYGKMIKIDRKKKQLYVGSGNKIISYDHLVITTGEQHQFPMPTGLTPTATINNPPADPDRWFMGIPPKNLFVVNDEYDAAVSLYNIERDIVHLKGEDKVVVYGSCLRAYCTVQALIKLGVDSKSIILAKPPKDANQPSCFNNPAIDAKMATVLNELNITVIERALLANWSINLGDVINNVTFLTDDGQFSTNCGALFSYTAKRVDLDAFRALNDACLVFDGKLVIDTSFHTNDISIRAAGSITKYQRKYHSDLWTHKNFNSKEIGIELASAMLSLFDPTMEPKEVPEEDRVKLIPMYRCAKIQAAVLPGGLHYLHYGKPSLNVPLEVQMMNADYGALLVTGDLEPSSKEVNFFRLHFNLYNYVETVTCLSKKPIDTFNIICLYGIHQRFLNNIMQRYKEGLITDFFSYFREAWCLAIYHDRFSDFRDEIRELLVNQPAPDVRALEEKVREMIDEDLNLSDGQRKNLAEIYSDTGVKRLIETRLLSFLSYNFYHLPMYAKPGMV